MQCNYDKNLSLFIRYNLILAVSINAQFGFCVVFASKLKLPFVTMSDVVSLCDMDHLDEKTKSIVYGFIREVSDMITHKIPDTIRIIILMSVDDHFMMNRGCYEWKIQKQIQAILSSPANASINSDIFEMCGLQWMMQLYPNGNSNISITAGNVGLFVKLLRFPKEWRYILIHQTFICHQTNTVSHHIAKFENDETC